MCEGFQKRINLEKRSQDDPPLKPFIIPYRNLYMAIVTTTSVWNQILYPVMTVVRLTGKRLTQTSIPSVERNGNRQLRTSMSVRVVAVRANTLRTMMGRKFFRVP